MRAHRLLVLVALAAAGAAGACKETNGPGRVASVAVSGSSGTLGVGESVQLTATARDEGGAALEGLTVSWSSSNPAVATVSSGLVQGVGGGNATITATVAGVTGSLALTVNNPAPNVSALSPATVLVGSGAFALTVTGTGFAAGSVVVWNGQDRPTEYVSPTTLKASIAAADVASGGLFDVLVRNPPPGGGRSSAVRFMARIEARGPTISASADAFSLRASGTTCAVRGNGEAYCWGSNEHGQVGDGTTTDRAMPTRVATGLPFASIVVGGAHACGLTTWGAAYCWGDGDYLGTGTTADALTPVPVTGGHTFVQLAAGADHTCGVTVAGALYCWGSNMNGRIGDGAAGDRVAPVVVGTGQTWQAVSAGGRHTCALTTTQWLYCWGWNGAGQLGDGTTGGDRFIPTPAAGTRFTAVSAGAEHTCALNPGGSAYCWGDGGYGQLGGGVANPSSLPVPVSGGHVFTQISAGDWYTCGLTQAGTAFCWGAGVLGNGQRGTALVPVPVNGPALRELAAGASHTCAIATSGTAYCWGERLRGTLGDGELSVRPSPVDVSDAVSGYRAIATGEDFTCGLSAAGPRCWGANAYGQLGDGTFAERTVPTPPAGGHDFSLISPGLPTLTPSAEWIAIGRAGPWGHACGLTAGGAAYCWGHNEDGALGNGTTAPAGAPTAVSGGLIFSDLDAGGLHTCGVASGAVWCWGSNWVGQLGDGTTGEPRLVPGPVTGVSGQRFAQVSTGSSHACAVTDAGRLYCWGDNAAGQIGNGDAGRTGVPPTWIDIGAPVASVSAGTSHTCAVATGGAAFCWGQNYSGQLGTGSTSNALRPTAVSGGLTFRAISAGMQVSLWSLQSTSTCGVTTAGVAYCWGYGGDGRLGTGSFTDAYVPTPVAGGGTYLDVRVGVSHACGVTTGGAVRCWGRLHNGELGIGISGVVLTPAPVQGNIVFDRSSCRAGRCAPAASRAARRW